MSKKWLIGVIGTTVLAATVLSGCGTSQDDMGGNAGHVSGTSSTTSTTHTTSTTASTTSSTASSTSGGILDEITNVQ